ncbi:MAG: hypothetical protein FWE32_08010 [Oscillospiraceae bacterium]|nr:hypothetical protein [Oscillospiraceae bacterium]
MENLEILTDKALVDADLLLLSEPSLPEAMRQLDMSEALVGMVSGKAVAVCLFVKRKHHYDVINLSIAPEYGESDAAKEMLLYAFDYIRAKGENLIEIGAGNAELFRHKALMSMGFRVIGVWRDHFLRKSRPINDIDGIPNCDLLRYQIDLRYA